MNVEQVNRVLGQAIMGLQESELAALAEAGLGLFTGSAYHVPSPGRLTRGSLRLLAPEDMVRKMGREWFVVKNPDGSENKMPGSFRTKKMAIRQAWGQIATYSAKKGAPLPKGAPTYAYDTYAHFAEATAVGRTSYQVPAPGHHPGGVGPAPKKAKPRMSAKWSKGTFDQVLNKDGRHSLDVVSADMRGVWAVHKSGYWKISHIPTGMNAFSGFDDKGDARAAVDLWVEEFPWMLWLGKDAEPGEPGGSLDKLTSISARLKELNDQAKKEGGEERFQKQYFGKPTKAEKKRVGNAVKSVGNKWVKAAFRKATEKGEAMDPTAAMMRGVWAVHKAENDPGTPSYRKEKGWIVSHAPSGYRVFSRFGTRKAAQEAVDAFIYDNPELISAAAKVKTGDNDAAASKLRPLLKRAASIVRQHGGR